jgi:Secretion system C-terminal sorting domain/Fibronectin type III domain
MSPVLALPTARYTSATEAADAWYFTQGIQLEAGSFYKISYKYGNNGATIESFTSGIATGPAAVSVTGTLATHDTVTGGTLTAFTFPNAFSVPQSGVYYLAFHATSGASQGTLYLDDIKVEAWTCDEPTGIAAGSITDTGATLTWTAPVNSVTQGYFSAYNTTSTPPENFQMSAGATVTLDGLAPGTTYYFFVKSFCGPTLGEWSAPVEFTTTGQAAGVAQNTFRSLTVYPNPAAASLTLHNTTMIEKAMVYNLTGQLVLSKTINSQDTTLDIERLSAGAYLLSVYANGEVKKLKVIKQ